MRESCVWSLSCSSTCPLTTFFMWLDKPVQPQQTASFSQHGSLFRPELRPGCSTQTQRLPTCQWTITHPHSRNTSVCPQQCSLLCGFEAPPQRAEAEETSTAACSLLITARKLLTNSGATTKTSRNRSHTFHCKLPPGSFSEPPPRGKIKGKICCQLQEGTTNQLTILP